MSTPEPGGAFVTGGARGIGHAICTRLAAEGRTVHAADLDASALEEAFSDQRAAGFDIRTVAVDVADCAALGSAIRDADRDSPLGVLVNNAGVGFAEPLATMTPERFDRLFSINVRAVYFAIQAAAEVMTPRGCGSIVNLASTSAFAASGSPMTAYDTSKGAVRMMTITTARELAARGIRVNAVAPGTIDTDLTRSIAPDQAALDDLVARRIPLGRLGAPDDIASAVAWLASDASSYVTGHTLVVDGGRLT
jgi:NAD(P)-dependent dehydrogenase (short-subunit alcohol dehydrogenase family)